MAAYLQGAHIPRERSDMLREVASWRRKGDAPVFARLFRSADCARSAPEVDKMVTVGSAKRRGGFTLVELLVAVAIVGLLMRPEFSETVSAEFCEMVAG